MARTPEFEDMQSHEWPKTLESLKIATEQAWETYAELDDLRDNVAAEDRGNIIELAGRAWALLRDLRAEGLRQLAKWGIAQGQLAGARCISCGWRGLKNPNEGSDCPACGAVALVGDKDEEVKIQKN